MLLGSLLVAACGGGGSTGSAPAAGAQPSAVASPAGGPVDSSKASVVHLVLTGGPKPGTYEVSSTKTCSTAKVNLQVLGGEQTMWDVGYGDSDINATTGLYTFGLTFASSKSPAPFTIGATVHEDVSSSGPGYSASTIVTDAAAGGGGSGTVTFRDSGKTALITFSIKSAAGYGMDGTVTCNQVTRA